MSGARQGYVARAMRRLAFRTRTFICISEYVRELVRGYGVPEAKLTRIYCATDAGVEAERPSTLRQELKLAPEVPVIGATGIWRPNKGFTYFVSAGERVHAAQPQARFLLGGRAYGPDASYATALWMRGQPLRDAGVLSYTGFLPDVGRFLSALDVFVLPSDCEPFGQVVIEAMARGLPVIATHAGGVPELVEADVTGILVPPRDPAALAAAILRLLGEPELRRRMGVAGRERVKRLFDRRRMVAEYEALYARLLAEGAGR